MKKLLPPFAWIIINALSKTIAVKALNETPWKKAGKVIFAFWHGEQFALIHRHRFQKITIMSSLSEDGQLQTEILERFGYNIVRGSSSRGGARALIAMLKALERGHSAAFAVDGPRGPTYEVKPGIIFIAKRTGLPIVPVSIEYLNAIHLKKTWDQYRLPLPFSSANIIYGNPYFLGSSLDETEIIKCCDELKGKMMSLKITKWRGKENP